LAECDFDEFYASNYGRFVSPEAWVRRVAINLAYARG
jgi:hypothetical protein